MKGFIKLHRKLVQWGWYQDSVIKDVFLHLLLTANFKDTPWKNRVLKEGQVVISTQRLADDLGFTRQQVRTALDKLRSTNEITSESTNKYTVVTITNWCDYQCESDLPTSKTTKSVTIEQPTDLMNKLLTNRGDPKNSTNKITSKKSLESVGTTEVWDFDTEQSTNNVTIEQPTNNQQITNKQPQRKNIKNNKNNIYAHLFDRFWSAYPKKKAKVNAEKAFAKLKVDESLLSVMLSAIEKQKQSDQWQKDNGQYIPYPSTWLNARRWEDSETEDIEPSQNNAVSLSELSNDYVIPASPDIDHVEDWRDLI